MNLATSLGATDVGIHFMNFTLSGRPAALRGHVRDTAVAAAGAGWAYAELGMQHVQLSLLTDEPARLVESFVARVVPRLAEL